MSTSNLVVLALAGLVLGGGGCVLRPIVYERPPRPARGVGTAETEARDAVRRLLADGTDRPGVVGLFYSSQTFGGRATVVVRPEVRFELGDDDPPQAEVSNDFSSRWIARLFVPKAGWWEFAAYADDGVRVWIDGRPVLDYWSEGRDWRHGWPIDLSQGHHEILVEHYDRGGPAALALLWRDLPGSQFKEIPQEAFHFHEGLREAIERLEEIRAGDPRARERTAAQALGLTAAAPEAPPAAARTSVRRSVASDDGDAGEVARLLGDGPMRPGVLAMFYADHEMRGRPVVRLRPDVRIECGGGSPEPGVPTDFASRWIARLDVPRAGWWEIRAEADDGVKVWIDGSPVIHDWTCAARERISAPVELSAGAHDLVVEHYDHGWDAALKLSWRDRRDGSFFEIAPEHLRVPEGLREAVDRLEARRTGDERLERRTTVQALGLRP